MVPVRVTVRSSPMKRARSQFGPRVNRSTGPSCIRLTSTTEHAECTEEKHLGFFSVISVASAVNQAAVESDPLPTDEGHIVARFSYHDDSAKPARSSGTGGLEALSSRRRPASNPDIFGRL